MESPFEYFKDAMRNNLEEAVKHLSDEKSYDIKIVDYGLARDLGGDAQKIKKMT